MNISKYKIILIALAVTFVSSCKKTFLELYPPTSLTIAQALGSEADMQVALRGAYSGLRNVDYYGRTLPVIGDLMADNTYQSLVNTNRYTSFNNYTFTVADANISGFWNAAYQTILRANNIINSSLTANANINEYKGEAYAIRALCYFDLIRWFARPYTDNPNGLGVPIITKYDPDLKPARNTITEVYTLINNDLNQAYSLMSIYTNSSQLSKYAARGLQAKVYLTMGDYNNAKTAALDVINNSGFTLVNAANYISYWNIAVPTTNKVETLFEVSSDAIVNNGTDALPNIYSQAGYGDMLASDDFYALLNPADVRKGLYQTGKKGGVNAVLINKYPNTYGTDISDTKVLRLSEMYLIAAESYLPGDETNAIKYLNILTAARNEPAITSTGAQLFEDVITERRRELAFEGDRYADLQRLKRDVVRSANYPASARMIPYSNFRRILPIPQSELDANANIRSQQNPGYQ